MSVSNHLPGDHTKKRSRLIPVASITLLVMLWWLGSLLAGEKLLPSPLTVFAIVGQEAQTGNLFIHTGITLWRVIASFTISMTLGIVIGFLMGRSKRTNNMLDPWLLFFLNLPALIVIILAYIWMGLTEIAAITAVAVNKIPNVVVTIREGVRAMDKNLQQMATIFCFGRWKKLRHIILPELAPYIAVATRSGIALIWKIVLVVELLGRSDGVGFQLYLYFQLFDIAAIMAWGLTFIIIMQIVELLFIQPFERRVNKWRQ